MRSVKSWFKQARCFKIKKYSFSYTSKKSIYHLALIAAVSVIWLILRTGRKPSRISYPCQRAAVTNINLFLFLLFSPLVGLLGKLMPKRILRSRTTKVILITGLIATMAISTFNLFNSDSPLTINPSPIILDIKLQTVAASSASNIFIIQNASGSHGNMDVALSALFSSMQNQGLNIFKTSTTPQGLIAKDDVIILKVNGQSPQRGSTNTDLAKSLIKTLIAHPEDFAGEIVIADNGQSTGGVDMTENNAYDHSQSMADVAGMFPTHRISAYSWWTIASQSVNEYNLGDYQDGYVVNSTSHPITNLKVSYPKFQTIHGTYISFKKGIWNQTTQTYDSSGLKIINMPLFKSHYNFGATACIKNYMGVVSQTLTGAHSTVGNGGMGTALIETRFPTLNIIDCIWINANPFQPSGSTNIACGPFTAYNEATFANLIGASTDPIALEYWIAKHVAIPTAQQNGYTYTSSIDPDYAPITENLVQSYHNYLLLSMDQIKNSEHQTTMQENQMNVYITNLTPTPTPTSSPTPTISPTPTPTPTSTPTPTPSSSPTPTPSYPTPTPQPNLEDNFPIEYIAAGLVVLLFVIIGIFFLTRKFRTKSL